jgi:uncharacterized protein (DUF302 family)
MSELSFDVRLGESHADAIELVTEALKEEGFGVLTRVDIHDAFREKLGAEFRAYTILGACNPPLALQALTGRPEVGLMLPCNVTVEAEPAGGSLVRIVDPRGMMQVGSLATDETLQQVATQARERLERVAARLTEDSVIRRT